MKIYTKKGDAGETGLYGNVRLPKDALRIQAYGTLDELNATLGLALSESAIPGSLFTQIRRLQGELFQLGAELATPSGKACASALIEDNHIFQMEKEIDEMENKLPPLQTFILPGGTRLASHLHFARTVSRRAERELTTLHRAEPCRAETLKYMNRLSDYLFVAARFANFEAQVADVPWTSP